jgi:hypothetical protein
MVWTGRVMVALLSIQARWIRWSTPEERDAIKTRVGQRSPFRHCVGFVDGLLMPMEFKPAREDHYDYWSRKYRYGINSLVVCDDEKRITFLKLGWGGSTHDTSVYRDTSVG